MRLLFSYFLFVTVLGFNSTDAHATPSHFPIADSVTKPKGRLKIKPVISFPAPANISKLFYVQRDPNTNTIIYELNTDKAGILNESNPVHVYWIKYAEKGQTEELNYIQRKFAYGINSKKLNDNAFDIRFASYKKFPMSLMKSADGKYHIFATIAEHQAILNRIFVKIEGGSFWIPNIVYVELKGTDPATGKEIMERFKP